MAENLEIDKHQAKDLLDRLHKSTDTFEKLMVGANVGGFLICLRVAEEHINPDANLPFEMFILTLIFFSGSISIFISYFLDVFGIGALSGDLLLISTNRDLDDLKTTPEKMVSWLQIIQRLEYYFVSYSMFALVLGGLTGMYFVLQLV